MNQGLKYVSHEVEYAAIATVTLVFLSFAIFPLFIALLPLVLIIGCTTVWRLDHFDKNKKT